ncbi:hypothetical protein UlMin_010381 [Ulmus minor]
MLCYGSTITGGENRFFFASKSNSFFAGRPVSEPNLSVSFLTRLPKPVSTARIPVGLVKAQADMNDDGLLFDWDNMNYYEILGVPETGSLAEIKSAYKRLARKYHPDVSPPGRVEEYTQAFLRVQTAYDNLCDPYRKALYDIELANEELPLSFYSVRKPSMNIFDGKMIDRSFWKSQWQAQLDGLKDVGKNKKRADAEISWGELIRMSQVEDEL